MSPFPLTSAQGSRIGPEVAENLGKSMRRAGFSGDEAA
jgi:hypothetical protein